MRFAVLGPLVASGDDGPVALGGPKQRLVLAHLLLRANTTVPVDRLIDAVWGDEPPESARATLQAYISRLRAVLGSERIEGEAPGYRFHVDPAELDKVRFESLLKEAAEDGLSPSEALGALDEALGLWRGPALADLADEASLRGEISRLEELRFVAIEERTGARLELGQHAVVVAELEQLTAAHPLRERLWGQLILALYRSGRQADALAAFGRMREQLAEELGIDPSRELQDLHERVLRQDESLQLAGEPLRGYRLLEKIGEGAFGAVYRAIQPHVEREVAVKSIHAELANQPDFVRRFEREAQLVARLEHPHIVPLYDYWREPDAAHLVMRFLRGGSLEDLLDEGPLELDRASSILDQIGAALTAAHQQGVVHRDVKPGNVLLDETGNAYLSDFGIALETGAPEQTAGTMIRGTPAYLSPEQIKLEPTSPRSDIYALGVVLYEMLTGEHPFPGTSLNVLLDQHLHQPMPSVRAKRPEIAPTVDAAIARATAKDPQARFADVLELCAAFRDAIGGAHVAVARDARNPYKGLRAFLEADSADFFGRELPTRRLLERVAEPGAPRFLCVVGPSGSGKSSVVRAGLVPAIRRGAIPGSERWFVVELTPGPHPLRELESALLGVSVDPPPSLLEELERDERGLSRAVDRILPEPEAELFIVLDQLEELFTMVGSDAERAHVLESLRVATSDPASRIRVVATLRADFFDQPLSVRGFGELLASRNEAITPMSPEELERAIVGPAERVGLDVEPGLVAAMIADVIDRPGALPLLQYALAELADADDVRALTLNAYRKIGGVSGAIARRAEQLYDGLDDGGRVACRQLFLRLVSIGEGTDGTRHRVRRSELQHLDDAGIDAAIESFGRHRLLSFDRDPDTREPTIEIAHESLLSAWGRLREWIDEARDDVRTLHRLETAAAEWTASGREDSFLLRGARLETMASWADTTTVALTAADQRYVEASVRRRDDEIAEEEARTERERSLQRRSLQRARALVAVLTGAVIVAALLMTLARRDRVRAEDQADIADARRLAAESVANLDADPERSILLALEAIEATRAHDGTVLPEAEDALHRALGASRVVLSLPGHSGVAFHPHRDLLAVGQTNGDVDIRDGATGETVVTLRGHSARINGVAFSADGERLATASEDGTVALWNTRAWRRIGVVSLPSGTPLSPALDPDGSVLAFSHQALFTGSNSPSGVAVGPAIGESFFGQETILPGGPGVAFSPDGVLFATGGGGEGPAVVWDAASRDRVWTLGSAVIDVAFSGDGAFLATAEENGAARMWSLRTGKLVRSFLGHTSSVEAVEFGPDSSLLASASLDGTIRIWDVRSGRTLNILPGQGAAIENVDFAKDGTRVVGGSSGGTALVWDITPEGSREVLTIPVDGALKLAMSPDGTTLLSGGLDGRAHLVDARSGEEVGTLTGHEGPVLRATYDPSGSLIATSGADGTVRIWDAATGAELRTLQHTSQAVGATVSSVGFSPDGSRLVSAGIGATRVWDVGTGEIVHTLFGHPVQLMVFDAAFSPSGDLIATSGQDETVRVWNAATGDAVWTGKHTSNVIDVAFSPRGDLVASGSLDGTVRLWQAASGAEVRVLRGHSGGVNGVAFSPDGSLLATASEDRTTRIWDVGTGNSILTLHGHSASVFNPVFFPDGRRLATVAEDGTIRIYTLSVDELLRLARSRVTRGFSAEECRLYDLAEPCGASPDRSPNSSAT